MRLRCRLFGHEFYWLDYRRQHHCIRCGACDVAFVARQAALDRIFNDAKRRRKRRREAAGKTKVPALMHGALRVTDPQTPHQRDHP